MRGRDAISVTDADAPPVVLAAEDHRDPKVDGHELVAVGALNLRMFDGNHVAEIVTSPAGHHFDHRWLTAHEHRCNPCGLGRDEFEPNDWRPEEIRQDDIVAA